MILPAASPLNACESAAPVTRLAIVYPERELIQPHVRAFVDAVVAGARKFLPE